MGLNRVFGIWGGGDSWDLFCLIFKLQIVMLQDWRLQGCYRHGFSLRGEIELTGTRQSGIENCTVGENVFLWSLASKSSWLTAVLQSPGENHFWRNTHVASGSELFVEKQSISLKSSERRENQGTVFSVLLMTLVGYSWMRRWSAERWSSPTTTNKKLRRVCLSPWGIKCRVTEMRPPVSPNSLCVPIGTSTNWQAKRRERWCGRSV